MFKSLFRIFSFFILTLLLFRCSQESITSDKLTNKDELMLLKSNGLPYSGLCIDSFENGEIKSEKNYKNGLLDGSFSRYYKNGQISVEVNYEMGKPIGGYKEYYESGRIKTEKIDNGKKQMLTRWFENGIKSAEMHFVNNILTGISEQWYDNGQKELTSTYENDKRTGSFLVWDKSGKRKIEGKYIDGQLDGKWTVWNESGQALSEEYYKNGKKVGTWLYYFNNGKKRLEVVYKDGLIKLNKEWDENGKVINSFEAK
jgi:uncharacterized protein